MNFVATLSDLENIIWGLPFLLFFFGTCLYMTLQLGFVQFRYFTKAIRAVFQSDESNSAVVVAGKLSPFQAFINTLGGNIGNGSLSGVPTAIALGGPGAIFWMLLMSTFSVSLRFAEVYLATYFSDKATSEKSGPMYYLSLLPFGSVLSYMFGVFGFIYMLTGGNLIQCNAVGSALNRSWGVSQEISAIFVFLFIAYVIIGGSDRIVKFLDKLVPVKVYGFLITAVIVLIYNFASIPHALYLMVSLAFNPQAVVGGTFGFAIQRSLAAGFSRGVNASEAGLGTAAVAFGATKGQDPIENGIMSMLSIYINTHIVCFLVALCIISSGSWQGGEVGIAMLVSSYETVFGSFGGLIVTILVAMFAMSVVVAYAYNARICWSFLLKGKASWLFSVIYILCAAAGTLMRAEVVWNLNGISTAALLAVNVLGLLWFTSTIKTGLTSYRKKHA